MGTDFCCWGCGKRVVAEFYDEDGNQIEGEVEVRAGQDMLVGMCEKCIANSTDS